MKNLDYNQEMKFGVNLLLTNFASQETKFPLVYLNFFSYIGNYKPPCIVTIQMVTM